jgi:hypothetical protein
MEGPDQSKKKKQYCLKKFFLKKEKNETPPLLQARGVRGERSSLLFFLLLESRVGTWGYACVLLLIQRVHEFFQALLGGRPQHLCARA